MVLTWIGSDGQYHYPTQLLQLVHLTGADGAKANSGGVYIFKKSGGTWSQQTVLTNPSSCADYLFGYSVYLQGGTLAVGEPASNDDACTSVSWNGAVHVYTGSGASWTHKKKNNLW